MSFTLHCRKFGDVKITHFWGKKFRLKNLIMLHITFSKFGHLEPLGAIGSYLKLFRAI